MKNIRKIVAILAAVLMLCSVVPMSAFAAPGDVALDKNFDDGTNGGFERAVNENGYIVFDATTADWQNTYAYVNGIKSDTLYKVTFKAKANKDAELNFKIQNDWAPAHVVETVEVTTEWQDYELTVNSGTVNPAVVLFTSGYTAANAPIYYIDDLKIVETVDPALIGKVVNGDFSSNDGWSLGNGATIADGVLKLENIGAWSEAAMQTVPVKANTNYEITWKSQCVSGSGVTYMTLMDAAFANMPVTSGQIWMTSTSTEWIDHTVTLNTGASEVIIFKLTSEDGATKTINIDDVKITEIKDPSFDGYIYNGDFETGKILPWDNLWGSNNVELVAGHNGDYAMKIVANGAWAHVRQTGIAVKPNTDYVIKMYAKDAANYALLVKDNADSGNVAQASLNAGSEWTPITFEFNSGNNSTILFSFMSNNAGDTCTVDDIFMFEKPEVSNDGYIVNGTFETGALTPWENLWGSCPTAEVIRGGKDDNFALNIVSGQWKHVRQLPITVEANTDYKITVWAKNAKAMSLLVKDAADTGNIANVGINGGEDWTENIVEFNSGENTAILVSFMGNEVEAYGTFDNIVMEKVAPAHVCEFVGEVTLEPTCTEPGTMTYSCTCGEGTYTEEIPAYHNGNMEYNAAKDPVDCANPGNIENWYCPGCNEYFADANAVSILNPWFIEITVDCVRPEGVADCATWTCEVCGTENYGAGEHDTGVPACQDGHCSKCDQDVAGYGCANYDTPACEDGVCYYCGGFVAGLGHENGTVAPCLEGECAYGCGLTYPATADHVDEDADDYCDVCWNHLAHDDADGDNYCDICFNEMPSEPDDEIIYGDADGDGEVTLTDAALLGQWLAGYEVTVDEAAADADGDGEITLTDAALLGQWLAGYDVTLGPV
ncbi:MAG: carbohydrate binding domain-containing protein [Clostridia bacterium]|nr:carbohydrate binding domain-containing protein [Clostridia bacterium]